MPGKHIGSRAVATGVSAHTDAYTHTETTGTQSSINTNTSRSVVARTVGEVLVDVLVDCLQVKRAAPLQQRRPRARQPVVCTQANTHKHAHMQGFKRQLVIGVFLKTWEEDTRCTNNLSTDQKTMLAAPQTHICSTTQRNTNTHVTCNSPQVLHL